MLSKVCYLKYGFQCFASMANSPYKCHNVVRNCVPRANVQKSLAPVGGRFVFGLIASVDIAPFTEILVNYGPGYIPEQIRVGTLK